MRTPTLQEFKAFARDNARLARAVCLAQAFAQCERERVDAYIRPVFDRFEFYVNPEWSNLKTAGERITEPKNLYLSAQEELCAQYYAECDKAHRAHGFTGPDGHCPALVAESLQIDAENALLDSGCEFLGVDRAALYLDNRKKMLDLLLGACINIDREKVAA